MSSACRAARRSLTATAARPLLDYVEQMRQATPKAGDKAIEVRDLLLQAAAPQTLLHLGADVRHVLLRQDAFEHDLNHPLLQLIRAHVMLIGADGSGAQTPSPRALRAQGGAFCYPEPHHYVSRIPPRSPRLRPP